MKYKVRYIVKFLSLITIVSGTSLGFYYLINPIENSQISLLALGDSYTIGESVKKSESWPFQLQVELESFGITLDFLEIIAKTGWDSMDLMNQIAIQGFQQSSFDYVTVLIGANDLYKSNPLELYISNFIEILELAIELAGDSPQNIIVLSIPDYSVSPLFCKCQKPWISSQIDIFNEANRVVSWDFGVRYVDITSISRMATYDLSLLAADQLHPSATMYKLWVEKLVIVIDD